MKERGWLLVAGLALIVVLLLAAFPARTYIEQQGRQQQAEAEVGSLANENRQLEGRVGHLQTDAEVERLAREQYGLVRPGEEVYAVVGPPTPPAQTPAPPAPPQPGKDWWDKALNVVTSVF